MPELKDSSDLKERIVAESQQYTKQTPGEDEFTIFDFMEWNEIERDPARRALIAMEKDAKVSKRKGKINGASCNVYKMIG